MINTNMRCIEMSAYLTKTINDTGINTNMRCIEMKEKQEHCSIA